VRFRSDWGWWAWGTRRGLEKKNGRRQCNLANQGGNRVQMSPDASLKKQAIQRGPGREGTLSFGIAGTGGLGLQRSEE
jgi:hypothetical protein